MQYDWIDLIGSTSGGDETSAEETETETKRQRDKEKKKQEKKKANIINYYVQKIIIADHDAGADADVDTDEIVIVP